MLQTFLPHSRSSPKSHCDPPPHPPTSPPPNSPPPPRVKQSKLLETSEEEEEEVWWQPSGTDKGDLLDVMKPCILGGGVIKYPRLHLEQGGSGWRCE